MNDGFASEPVPAQGNLPLRPQSGVPDPAVQAGQMPVAMEYALADGFAARLALLARRAGAAAAAVRWVERAAFAISRATAQGHVCIALESLAEFAPAGSMADLPGETAAMRAQLLASGMVCDGTGPGTALLPLVLDAQNRLYLARYYDFERQLAGALLERAHTGESSPVTAWDGSLQAFFTPVPRGEIDWQRVAVALALGGRLTVISGGPGTGKTTTVVAILAGLLAQAEARRAPLRIALAAPTGKAAQRMQEALLERAGNLPAQAAARLPAQSYTLHRLLGVGPGGQFRHHRAAPLPYDVIVVDEASMIDVALAARLIDAIAPGARLILLGDKDQLSAVEAGAVFAELSAHPALSSARLTQLAAQLQVSEQQLAQAWPQAGGDGAASHATAAPLADCVVWLERNYRFGLGSSIGQLSLAIRAGQVQAALAILQSGDSSATLHADAAANLGPLSLAALADGYTAYVAALAGWLGARLQADAGAHRAADVVGEFERVHSVHESGAVDAVDAVNAVDAVHVADVQPLFDAFNQFRVLCAVRAGARGVERLNLELAQRVRQALAARSGGTAPPGDALWYAGRAVMVTRNDYALGLFNGDIGIALPAGPCADTLRVWFRAADGRYRAVSPAALPPHDTAFAMTVHKSQGSEFQRVALVMPAAASRVLTRELVYTAVTRARTAVAIYAAPDVLAKAIAERTARDSGLASRLAEAAALQAANQA
jgi:exodeoxyribonuclease V alpha subunit